MLSVEKSPAVWLNRPYIDLGPFHNGPLTVYDVELNYQNLINDHIEPYGLQRGISASFRPALLKETGLTQYQVDDPLELPEELRTERWNKLCEYLINYQDLQPEKQLRVISLLSSLGLHQAVLKYIPNIPEKAITNNPMLAALAFSKVTANIALQVNKQIPYDLEELKILAQKTPFGSAIRITAAIQMAVWHTKFFKDLDQAEYWRGIAEQELHKIQPLVNDFTYQLLTSIFYRGVSFVPMMRRDQQTVVAEMDLCQSYAENLPCETEIQRMVANENLHIILESRTKEAIWIGDLDLAEERAQKLVDLEPLYSTYRLELGEVLIKKGKIHQALEVYHSATRLGPPGTAIAWFMTGQCYEALGALDMACDCYLSSLNIDPLAISAIEQINKISAYLTDPMLNNWSKLRLQELKKQKQEMSSAQRQPKQKIAKNKSLVMTA